MGKIAPGKARNALFGGKSANGAPKIYFDAVRVEHGYYRYSSFKNRPSDVNAAKALPVLKSRANLVKKAEQKERSEPLASVGCAHEEGATAGVSEGEYGDFSPEHAFPHTKSPRLRMSTEQFPYVIFKVCCRRQLAKIHNFFSPTIHFRDNIC